MQRTAKIRTLEPLEYHISVQVSILRLFYASTSLMFSSEGVLFQFTGFQKFPENSEIVCPN